MFKQRSFPKLKEKSFFPIAFGGAAISGEGKGYGFGDISEKEARNLIHHAIDLGINVFDTAPIYGFGLSERRLGKVFSENQSLRDKSYIISKCGVTWDEKKRVDINNGVKTTQHMLDETLARLDIDHIDLYMIHWPDPQRDIRRTMEVLSKAKERGKIGAIGLCNTGAEDLRKALEIDDLMAIQGELNLFERERFEELQPFIKEYELGYMSWGTLEKGILTKRVTKDRSFSKSDARSWAPWWKKMEKDPKYQVVEELERMLLSRGLDPKEGLRDLAIWHNLNHQEVTFALCGARTKDQLETLIQSLENPIDHEIIEEALDIDKKIRNCSDGK